MCNRFEEPNKNRWKSKHNDKYEKNKFAIIEFLCNPKNDWQTGELVYLLITFGHLFEGLSHV